MCYGHVCAFISYILSHVFTLTFIYTSTCIQNHCVNMHNNYVYMVFACQTLVIFLLSSEFVIVASTLINWSLVIITSILASAKRNEHLTSL